MKRIFIFYILLLSIQGVHAQRFGIQGGLNIARMKGLKDPGMSLLGIHAGPVVEFSLFDQVFINSGLLYSEKGFRFNGSSPILNPQPGFDPGIIKNSIGYLEIPVLMVYKLPLEEKGAWLYLQGGPNISYSCVHQTLIDNKFDYGINLGIGVEVKRIRVGLNYNIGLRDVWTTKNRVFQISTAYLFGGKRGIKAST